MDITNIFEVESGLAGLIEQMQQGKEVIIGTAGKPIAKLVPYNTDQTNRKLGGSWEGKVKMADDFDELPKDIMDAFLGNNKS